MPCRVDLSGAVAARVVRLLPGCAVDVGEGRGKAEGVVGRAPLRGRQDESWPRRDRARRVGACGAAERIGAGQEAVVGVPLGAGDAAIGVDLGDDLEAVVDDVAAGLAQVRRDRGHPVAGGFVCAVLVDSQGHVAFGAALGDAAVAFVVDVVVAAVVGVRPGEDAVFVVVFETQRQAGGVGDLGEVAAGVAVADDLLVACRRGRPRRGEGR